MRRLLLLVAVLAAACAAPARAAENHDGCTAFITSLPAVITASGVHCLKTDLATVINHGEAIRIKTNNVTIDCNNFRIDGSGAGLATTTIGIYAVDQNNVTVRRCGVRGFQYGVMLLPSGTTSGHVVEENRLFANTIAGIRIEAGNTLIRDNFIGDTDGTSVLVGRMGIVTAGNHFSVVGNIVDTVHGKNAWGIYALAAGQSLIQGNTVRRVTRIGAGGYDDAISVNGGDGAVIRDNMVMGAGSGAGVDAGTGIYCDVANTGLMVDNVITGMYLPLDRCSDGGGTVVVP